MYKTKLKKQKGGNGLTVKTLDDELIELTGLVVKESELLNILKKSEWKRESTIKLNISKEILIIIDTNQKLTNFDLNKLIEIAKAADYLSMNNYIEQVTIVIADKLKEQL